MNRTHFESDDETFSAEAYRVSGWGKGIAFYVLGWETEPDEDTEWTGIEERTGRVVVVMVGDDARHVVDEEDIEPLPREDYCGSCGQIGCYHDGYDRSEEESEELAA
jgi:hypothetical protein